MAWEEVGGKWKSTGPKVCEPIGRKRNLGDLTPEQLSALVQRQKELFAKKKEGGLDIDEEYNCYTLKKSMTEYRKQVLWEYLGLGDFADDCNEDLSIGCEIFTWNDKYVGATQKSVDEGWEEVYNEAI